MRKIGLVGGTGPESTVMYYKKLNSEIDRLSEGKNYARHCDRKRKFPESMGLCFK